MSLTLQIDLMMDNLVSDKGTAAVVDGGRLLVTPLQRALIPPPMCAAAADFPGPVQCCAFGEHEGDEVLLLQYLQGNNRQEQAMSFGVSSTCSLGNLQPLSVWR